MMYNSSMNNTILYICITYVTLLYIDTITCSRNRKSPYGLMISNKGLNTTAMKSVPTHHISVVAG